MTSGHRAQLIASLRSSICNTRPSPAWGAFCNHKRGCDDKVMAI